jgi:DNA-binding winged helix-turn-helix (wHTH) protein/Flp pilus assembly protein TadD
MLRKSAERSPQANIILADFELPIEGRVPRDAQVRRTMDKQAATPAVAFEHFVLDPTQRRLLRHGKPVALHGKSFELLSVLVACGGAAISRQDLYDKLWPNDVVEDGNLTQNIYLLRRALDPSESGKSFIETLPRFGYRFAAPVFEVRRPPWYRSPGCRKYLAGGALAAAVLILFSSGSPVRSNSDALDSRASVAYSLGMYHLDMRTQADLRQSVRYFTQTVHEAPRSALGYAGLACAYALEAEFETPESPSFKRELTFAARNRDAALARDARSSYAHAAAAFLAFRFDNKPDVAEREFRLAFAADPRNAAAHHWHAIFLFSRGAIGAATTEWELARQLDPTSEVISRWLGRAYVYQRRSDDAVRALSDTIQIEPADAPAWLSLATAQEQRGDLRGALQSLETVRRRMPYESAIVIPDEARVRLLLTHAADPRTVQQMDRLAAKREVDPVESALFYVALGSRGRAIAELRDWHPQTPVAASLEKFDPRFDGVRSDPRFQKLFE